MLARLSETQRQQLHTYACSEPPHLDKNIVDLVSVLIGLRDAALLEFVATGPTPERALDNAESTQLAAVLDDLPLDAAFIANPTATATQYRAACFISYLPDRIDAITTGYESQDEFGLLLGYPEDAVTAFTDGTVTPTELRHWNDNGRLTTTQTRNLSFNPYMPPQDDIATHASHGYFRYTVLKSVARNHNFPAVEAAIEREYKRGSFGTWATKLLNIAAHVQPGGSIWKYARTLRNWANTLSSRLHRTTAPS